MAVKANKPTTIPEEVNKVPVAKQTIPLSFTIVVDRETGAFGYTHNIRAEPGKLIEDVGIVLEGFSFLEKELNQVRTQATVDQALEEKAQQENKKEK